MKTPFYKSPRAHKWGLFCLLAGALAFDISINPQTQHFTADFASESPSSESVKVQVDDNTYEFVTSKQDGKVQDAHFVNNGTAADNGLCPNLCGKLIDLKGISNIEDVLKFKVKEAQSEAKEDKPHDSHEVADADKPKKVQKPGHITDFSSDDASDWAEKCADKGKDDKLSCQAKRLVDLSKYLEDSSDEGSIIADYFKKYVQPSMNAKYKSPVVKLSGGVYERDDDALSNMDDIASDILSGLREENGSKTRDMLTKMIAKTYSDQIKTGQNMIREGQQTSNVAEIYAGMNNLSPQYWAQRLADQTDTLTTSGDDTVEDLINKNLSNPVSSMLSQMAASGQRALSQNTNQVAKMSDGLASPCISFCQGYLNFDPNSIAGLNGVGSIVGSTRAVGRGVSVSQAPWFNNVNIGANGQVINNGMNGINGQPQYVNGQLMNTNGQFVGSNLPGGYQQQPMIGQPIYNQPMYNNNINPAFNNGMNTGINTGINGGGVVRSAGRIQ